MSSIMVDLPTSRSVLFLPERRRVAVEASILGTTPVAVPIVDAEAMIVAASRPRRSEEDLFHEIAHVDGMGLYVRSPVFRDPVQLASGSFDLQGLAHRYPFVRNEGLRLPRIGDARTEEAVMGQYASVRIVDDGAETAASWASALEQAFIVRGGEVWQRLGAPPVLALDPVGNIFDPARSDPVWAKLAPFYGIGTNGSKSAVLFPLWEADEAEAFACSMGIGRVSRSANLYEVHDRAAIEAVTPSEDALVADRVRRLVKPLGEISTIAARLGASDPDSDAAKAAQALTVPGELSDAGLLEAVEAVLADPRFDSSSLSAAVRLQMRRRRRASAVSPESGDETAWETPFL